MPDPLVHRQTFVHDPSARGFSILYRQDVVNHCPGCGRTHWIIGRFSAECAFCATAVPLADTGMLGVGTRGRNRRSETDFADAA